MRFILIALVISLLSACEINGSSLNKTNQAPQKPEELTEPQAPQKPEELTQPPVPKNQPKPTPAMVYQPSKKQKERLTQQPAVPFEKLPMKQQDKVRESEILPMLAPAKLKHPVNDSLEMMFLIARDDEGDYLYGEGAITLSTYMNFIKVVNKYKDRGVDLKRLMMHSPGGTMSSGQKIATYLHSNGWTTDSSKHMRCYSACGFIFASGTKKRMEPGAEIGFHRPYIPDQADTPEFIEATYYRYLDFWIEIGGTRELYDEFMLNYSRDDMLILKSNTINNHFKVEKY